MKTIKNKKKEKYKRKLHQRTHQHCTNPSCKIPMKVMETTEAIAILFLIGEPNEVKKGYYTTLWASGRNLASIRVSDFLCFVFTGNFGQFF